VTPRRFVERSPRFGRLRGWMPPCCSPAKQEPGKSFSPARYTLRARGGIIRSSRSIAPPSPAA
jgi:hypothetical protein